MTCSLSTDSVRSGAEKSGKVACEHVQMSGLRDVLRALCRWAEHGEASLRRCVRDDPWRGASEQEQGVVNACASQSC